MPSTRRYPVREWLVPVQCLVGEVCSVSVDDQMLKYGSCVINGYEGARNDWACKERLSSSKKIDVNCFMVKVVLKNVLQATSAFVCLLVLDCKG